MHDTWHYVNFSLSVRQTRGSHKTYGITSNVIVQGQSRAKKRVIYFLTVFVIGGIFSKEVCVASYIMYK